MEILWNSKFQLRKRRLNASLWAQIVYPQEPWSLTGGKRLVWLTDVGKFCLLTGMILVSLLFTFVGGFAPVLEAKNSFIVLSWCLCNSFVYVSRPWAKRVLWSSIFLLLLNHIWNFGLLAFGCHNVCHSFVSTFEKCFLLLATFPSPTCLLFPDRPCNWPSICKWLPLV